MIDVIARDGPLLIFCELGHLVATAVPLGQSGLRLKDIESVWELQRKLIDDERLPLKRASDTVWGALCRLQEQVNVLCCKNKNTSGDSAILKRLLGMMNLASSSRGSRDSINRFNSASESTALAVTVEPSSGTRGSESEDVFGRESFIKYPELLLTFIQSILQITLYLARERPMVGRNLQKSLLNAMSWFPIAFHPPTSQSKASLVSESRIEPLLIPH